MREKNRLRIIFDLESTCWEDKDFQAANSEIIEIGAVKFNCKSFELVDKFQTFVKPLYYTELSDYCKNLTSITQADIDTAPSFATAYWHFMSWAGDCPLFIGWGESDGAELAKACKQHSIECFPARKYLNGKQLYTYFTGIRGGGLKKRVTTAGLQFQGTQHRGIDDAIMTYELLKKVWFDF